MSAAHLTRPLCYAHHAVTLALQDLRHVLVQLVRVQGDLRDEAHVHHTCTSRVTPSINVVREPKNAY